MTEIKDKIERRELDSLIPYTNNPKEHPDSQIDKIASSIKNYGWDVPIVVDGENEIIKGHGRYQAAQKLGLDKVPVIERDDLSEAEVKAARIADNKTTESEWDMEALELEFEELESEDVELDLTGFDESEISEIHDSQQEAEEDGFEADVDEDEEAEAERGEIYQLGEHRLMCGDATEEEDVDALMAGEEADMVFTDPPYGVNYDYNEYEDVQGADYEKLVKEYMDLVLDLAPFVVITPGKANEGIYHRNYEVLDSAVWNKKFALTHGKVYNAMVTEPVLFFGNKPKNERLDTDLIEQKTDRIEGLGENHSCPKPVGLLEEIFKTFSQKGHLIIDLFGGSGSTLIAAEQLDRKCYMMEIDPHYVDVIIDRWEEYTGKQAELVS